MKKTKEPSAYSVGILSGLGYWDKPVYGGTVSYEERQRRRTKNRAARKARRITRKRSN